MSILWCPSIKSNRYRIVRDYEKYIARQFKRGTSRQELNVSWLKKNELDLKRHVSEIRDSIRNNWTSTGQELGKELQKFWQNSRPASPARVGYAASNGEEGRGEPLRSPSALSHLSQRLNLPVGAAGGPSNDFATGYSLGLIGGVRSWVSSDIIALMNNCWRVIDDQEPPNRPR